MKQKWEELNRQIKAYRQWFVLHVKNMWLFFRQDYKQILLFTMLCALLSFMVSEILEYVLPKLLYILTGISYLNQSNTLEVVGNPVSLLFILIYLVTATYLALFEISGLLHAFSMAQIGRQSSLSAMIMAGLHTVKKTTKPKNWLAIPFIFVLLPLTGVLTLSVTGLKMRIPYFILQGIEANPIWNRAYVIVSFILICIEVIYLFSINIYVLRNVSFLQACKESYRLGRDRLVHTIVTMALIMLGVNFIINSISSIIPTNVAEFISLFNRNLSVAKRSALVGESVFIIRTILKTLYGPAVNNAALTVLFYTYVEEKKLLGKLSPETFANNEMTKKVMVRARMALTVLTVGFLVFCVMHYWYIWEPVAMPEVCAHRGDNVHAPENTLESVELALNETIEYVEVDVFEALDGTIICSHDESLQRVTGYPVKVTEKTFEELKAYKMLDSLPGNYTNVTVPSLESVVKAVSETDKILQIELKTNGHDQYLEEEVVRLIHAYNLEDRAIVISLKSNTIERIKEIDPTITTAVCAFIAWEGFVSIPYSDHLSINESEVTPDLVRALHKQGKKVLCWTVDSEDAVQYLVSCGIDVIGTNDPLTILSAVNEADTKGGIPRAFHLLMNEIAKMGQ